jgi:hypothetical protein
VTVAVGLVWALALGIVLWTLAITVMDGGGPPPPVHPAVPKAELTLLFVTVTLAGRAVVLDGLLHVEGAETGVPTTWTLEPTDDVVFRSATIGVLQRWGDTATTVDVDLRRLTGPTPVLGLAHDQHFVQLTVVGPSAPSAGEDRRTSSS